MASLRPVGDLLREWRCRRGLSQLALATEAEISARHLSFLETGRSLPSRDMLLRLAEQLQIPLRERNVLLTAAGFAAVFPERQLTDPALDVIRKAIDVILTAHRPYPAFVIDRHWTLVASNDALTPFLGGIEPALLQSPVNVLRLTLHPGGLAPRLANYHEWRAHVLDKLHQQVALTGNPVLAELREELRDYPAPPGSGVATMPSSVDQQCHRIVVPFQFRTDAGILSFFSTTTVFGTPVDITLSELSLESFYPADSATADALQKAAAARQQGNPNSAALVQSASS
jgi:transcriptional regulator with XRE-family HTH domain